MPKLHRQFPCMILLSVLIFLPSCQNKSTNTDATGSTAEDMRFQYYDSGLLSETLSETDQQNLVSYQKVSETNLLSLYINKDTSYIAVADKRTGKVWYSVPPDIETDPNVNDSARPLSQSTLSVDYTQSQISKSMDNYTYSIKNKNFEIITIENGVQILYKVGDTALTIADIPQKLNNERFQEFFVTNTHLTEVDKIRMSKYYQYNTAGGYWEYIEDDSKLVYLQDIFQRANYTDSELAKDNTEYAIQTASKKAYFNIPVSYTLQGESLIVDIPLEDITYNEDCPPLEINLLQNFGAALNNENGYIFVPDGSGALLSFDDTQKKTGIYKTRVYGADKTIPVKQKSLLEYKTNLPVFGLKAGDNAYFAVIEDADAIASINAVRAKTMNSYNSSYASFTLREKQEVYLNNDGATYLTATQKNAYEGNITLRYSFLAKEDASYSGMARYYHQYVIDCYGLNADHKTNYNLSLQIVGAIDKEKSIIGVTYDGREALTTFDQTISILDDLKQMGISAINLQYNGWMNGGINQYSAKKMNILGCLGGKSGFDQLNAYANTNRVNVFYTVNLLSVPQSSKYFGKYSNAAKTINNSIANRYRYDIVTGKSEDPQYIVSLNYLETVADAVAKTSNKLKVNHLSLDDLGRYLYSDFGDENADNRQAALFVHKRALQEIGSSVQNIMTNDANIYALQQEDVIINAPLSSNESIIFDQTIPFYTMVLHGLVEYSGSPLNYSDDLQKDILRLAETGAEPNFSFMYADSSEVKFSKYTYLYAANYSLWKEKTAEIFQKLQESLSLVQDQQIVEHEQIRSNVYKTTYENGSSIYVNYSDTPVTVDTMTINAMDFMLIRGEQL